MASWWGRKHDRTLRRQEARAEARTHESEGKLWKGNENGEGVCCTETGGGACP